MQEGLCHWYKHVQHLLFPFYTLFHEFRFHRTSRRYWFPYPLPFDKLEEPITVEAKVRYSGKPAEAVISPLRDGKVKVSFKEKQRAITKGQSVVFYQGNKVVGGGIIAGII